MTTIHQHQICYLALGSNLNQPVKQLHTAIKHINQLPKTQFLQSATWYQSKPWGVAAQNDFVNTVISITTQLQPLKLLQSLKTIEYRLMNRQANDRWHERCIDIDILLFGRAELNRSDLIIPHRFISERCFVVKPLMELNPKLPQKLLNSIQSHQRNHNCSDELELISRVKFF